MNHPKIPKINPKTSFGLSISQAIPQNVLGRFLSLLEYTCSANNYLKTCFQIDFWFNGYIHRLKLHYNKNNLF